MAAIRALSSTTTTTTILLDKGGSTTTSSSKPKKPFFSIPITLAAVPIPPLISMNTPLTRSSQRTKQDVATTSNDHRLRSILLGAAGLGVAAALVITSGGGGGGGCASASELPIILDSSTTITNSLQFNEPQNALSLPTWAIHVSSVAEWVTAMILVWQYGEKPGYESWKGLSWGMVPLLGGAFCACTWHFFYNSETLNVLVALQAALTVIGNFTMCIAAYRIYKKSSNGSSENL